VGCAVKNTTNHNKWYCHLIYPWSYWSEKHSVSFPTIHLIILYFQQEIHGISRHSEYCCITSNKRTIVNVTCKKILESSTFAVSSALCRRNQLSLRWQYLPNAQGGLMWICLKRYVIKFSQLNKYEVIDDQFFPHCLH
jgi:hypothetical protein